MSQTGTRQTLYGLLSQDPPHLFGYHPFLDRALRDLGYYAFLNGDFHAAAQGDDSLLLPWEVGEVLISAFGDTATPWYDLSETHLMADIRADGRSDYNCIGVDDSRLYGHVAHLANRVLIITATGAALPIIRDYNSEGIGGKFITAVQVSPSGKAIRILYGNAQWGTLPSSETQMHLLSSAIMTEQGHEFAAMVHCHPLPMVMLSLHPRIAHDERRYNAALLTRIQSMLFHGKSGFTVKLLPYADPGSVELVDLNLEAMPSYPLLLWENHGTAARAATIHAAYAMTASASRAAEAALMSLTHGYVGFPMTSSLSELLEKHGLTEAYRQLCGSTTTPLCL